jgi:hypothetical protein
LIPLTQIFDRSLFWFGTDTSIESGGAKNYFYGPKPESDKFWKSQHSPLKIFMDLNLEPIHKRNMFVFYPLCGFGGTDFHRSQGSIQFNTLKKVNIGYDLFCITWNSQLWPVQNVFRMKLLPVYYNRFDCAKFQHQLVA